MKNIKKDGDMNQKLHEMQSNIDVILLLVILMFFMLLAIIFKMFWF